MKEKYSEVKVVCISVIQLSQENTLTKNVVNIGIVEVSMNSLGTLTGVRIWFGIVLWHINLCRLFNVKPIFIHINSYISNNSI